MSGEHTDGGPNSRWTGIAAELASAGFDDAREVGCGSSGVVYRCYQNSLGRTVAIKVLASDLDPANRERFLREGFAMGKLSGHPNIVNILQVGVTASNRPYIVMPYHAADSLALRLRRSGPIPWPEALKIGVKLCGALEIAHRSGTLHRDIKPGNVLLTDYGEPQLSDFGIARIPGKYQTVTGVFSGTIAYTSPEVLSGRPPTVAADLYSLGATMYAVIAGTAPHENAGGDELIAHYLRITSEEVPDLRPGGIPDDVCATIEQAMSLDPAKRPASAADLGRAFQTAQRRNGLPADSMALPVANAGDSGGGHGTSHGPFSHSESPAPQSGTSQLSDMPFTAPIEPTGAMEPPVWGTTGTSGYGNMAAAPPSVAGMAAQEERTSVPSNVDPMPGPGIAGIPPWGSEPPKPLADHGRTRRRWILLGTLAAVAVLVVVIGIGVVVIRRDGGAGNVAVSGAPPTSTAQAQAGWRPIANAHFALTAAATTQVDGTIWIFGGLDAGGTVTDDTRVTTRPSTTGRAATTSPIRFRVRCR